MFPHPEDALRLHRGEVLRLQREREWALAATVRMRARDDKPTPVTERDDPR